jgi:hypothetical protein
LLRLIGVAKFALVVAAVGYAVAQKLRGSGSPVTKDQWADVAEKPTP